MVPQYCPCGNRQLSNMPHGAPNEAWCGACDGIVEIWSDGTHHVYNAPTIPPNSF